VKLEISYVAIAVLADYESRHFSIIRFDVTHFLRSIIIIGLYASPAWWGYATAADKRRVEAFIRRGIRLGLYRADVPTTTQLTDNNDDNLFSSLLTYQRTPRTQTAAS